MKTILCYGDSNTYGYNPANGMRYPADVRWTGRLQRMLGSDCHIVEEGCNGRTTVFDDPLEGWKNGLDYLKPCLNSHKPVDVVILMLGSNDLKEVFHASAQEAALGAGELVDVILSFTKEKQGFLPKVILVSPPEIGEEIGSSPFRGSFSASAVRRSREFQSAYRNVADQKNCVFFDAARYARPSELDSLHLSPEAHQSLAEGLYRVVSGILGQIDEV